MSCVCRGIGRGRTSGQVGLEEWLVSQGEVVQMPNCDVMAALCRESWVDVSLERLEIEGCRISEEIEQEG